MLIMNQKRDMITHIDKPECIIVSESTYNKGDGVIWVINGKCTTEQEVYGVYEKYAKAKIVLSEIFKAFDEGKRTYQMPAK